MGCKNCEEYKKFLSEELDQKERALKIIDDKTRLINAYQMVAEGQNEIIKREKVLIKKLMKGKFGKRVVR